MVEARSQMPMDDCGQRRSPFAVAASVGQLRGPGASPHMGLWAALLPEY
jgi:hypothetical protein